MTYEGVPNKKRRLYMDESGNSVPLDLKAESLGLGFLPGSGILNSGGWLTVTGTQFKVDSFIYAAYEAAAAGTVPMAIQRLSGAATFFGDASTGFFYFVLGA